jgi:hypothetical protein
LQQKKQVRRQKDIILTYRGMTVISNEDIHGIPTIRPPFFNSRVFDDIFWRMIYATESTDLYYVSSLIDDVNYDFIQKTSKLDSNVFMHDDSLLYKFGNKFSCDIFKIKKDKHGYMMFKAFEHAIKNMDEFNTLVYAPNRNIIPHGPTQYVFSHLPILNDAAIFDRSAFTNG